MKIIGVVGTRRRDKQEDFEKIRDAFLSVYQPGDGICSGLCPKGGDRFAVILSRELEISEDKIFWYLPEWNKYGMAAGFIRNTLIANKSNVLIACVAEDRKGGAEDTIKKFIKKNKGKNDELIIVK